MITAKLDWIIHELIEKGKGVAFEKYIKLYESMPSAKHLQEPEYSNFMDYKVRHCYNQVRKEHPELREIS